MGHDQKQGNVITTIGRELCLRNAKQSNACAFERFIVVSCFQQKEKEVKRVPSHKEVYTYFVGTGVLDCPLARKFDTQKTNNNPRQIFHCLSGLTVQ